MSDTYLNDGSYACLTCDNFDKCESHLKNQSESVYCTNHKLKYGLKWFYLRNTEKEKGNHTIYCGKQ